MAWTAITETCTTVTEEPTPPQGAQHSRVTGLGRRLFTKITVLDIYIGLPRREGAIGVFSTVAGLLLPLWRAQAPRLAS